MSKKWNVSEIAAQVQSYFAAKKVADPTYSPNKDTISNLIDRIAKVVFIESTNAIDKLANVITGEELMYGNEIVEYFINMIAPEGFDDFEGNTNYTKALAPYRPQGDTAYISEKLPRKVFPMTVDYSRYDNACVNEAERANLVATFVFKLNQAQEIWRYNLKKYSLGLMASKANAVGSAVNYVAGTTVPVCGVVYKATGDTNLYIMKKNFDAATSSTLAQLTTAGDAVVITVDLVDTTTARPVDTATCEASLKKFKQDIQDMSYFVEGHTLSGTAASTDKPTLFILKGLKAVYDVECLSGSFNPEYLNLGVNVIEVEDFGNAAPANTWAILADTRGIKLSPTEVNYSREQINALGDYYSIFAHKQYELFISTHTCVKAYIHA